MFFLFFWQMGATHSSVEQAQDRWPNKSQLPLSIKLHWHSITEPDNKDNCITFLFLHHILLWCHKLCSHTHSNKKKKKKKSSSQVPCYIGPCFTLFCLSVCQEIVFHTNKLVNNKHVHFLKLLYHNNTNNIKRVRC